MEKQGIILLAQVDHLSGEEIGQELEALQPPSVYNKQLIPTLTKKGRPGYILLLDVHPDKHEEVGRFLLQHLGVRGYHRLETSHVFEETVSKNVLITIRHGEGCVQACADLKYVKNQPVESASFENDDIVGLYCQVKDVLGVNIPFFEFKRRLSALLMGKCGDKLEMQL